MPKLMVSEVLKNASKLKSKEERVKYLKLNDSPALRDVLRIAYDDDIISLLPEGAPPYNEDSMPSGLNHSTLHKAHKKFKYFFKGPIALRVQPIKRESMFVNILETLHADEAKLLVLAKDKSLKWPTITKKLVSDAFPGLIRK